MSYKIMVIDDSRFQRESIYNAVLNVKEFDVIYVWAKSDLQKYKDVPVDAYIVDAFLDENDWNHINAASLFRDELYSMPRKSPVILLSTKWSDPSILEILRTMRSMTDDVIQYLAWSEFIAASEDSGNGNQRKAALIEKIRSELDRWHGSSRFNPGPDDTIRILVISDTQFGDPDTDPRSTFSENRVAKYFTREAYQSKDSSKLPSIIVFSGDISFDGSPSQFERAEERIKYDLVIPLWGENNINRMKDRLVFVPGNHDVNLRFSACDKYNYSVKDKKFHELESHSPNYVETPYTNHHSYALEPFRKFAYRMTGDYHWANNDSNSWVDRRFNHCGFRFFNINTVNSLTADSPTLGILDEPSLRNITRSLSDDDPDSIFSIALSHHGLPSRTDLEGRISNWDSVGREFFAMHRIRLWVFGHYHEYETYSVNSRPFDNIPLWNLQLPTLRMKANYPGRGFCSIDLYRSDGVVIKTTIKNYTFDQAGTLSNNITKEISTDK